MGNFPQIDYNANDNDDNTQLNDEKDHVKRMSLIIKEIKRISKLSLEDLTNSFVNANLKIRGVEKYQHDRIMIQGEKND